MRLALRLKLESGRLSDDQAASVAKALDDTALVIERSYGAVRSRARARLARESYGSPAALA
jgi:hypothetical protein